MNFQLLWTTRPGQIGLCLTGMVLVMLPGAVRSEMDEWAGRYEVERIERGYGEWTYDKAEDRWLESGLAHWEIVRQFVEIRADRYLKAGSTWTCGAERDVIRGEARFLPGRIDLYERRYPYREVRQPGVIATMETRPGRRIVRVYPLDDGHTVKLVFRRAANAETWLDVIGL